MLSASGKSIETGAFLPIATDRSRNDAVEMNGERSRLGCGSARPRAEHRRQCTQPSVNRFACAEWPARARPTAPETGALPKTIALLRLNEAAVPRRRWLTIWLGKHARPGTACV